MANDDAEVLYKPDEGDQERIEQKKRYLNVLRCLCVILISLSILFSWMIFIREIDICNYHSSICEGDGPYTPEQLHLSLGADDSEYYATWSTMKPAETYLIWYRVPMKDKVQIVKAERDDGYFDSDQSKGKKYHKYTYRAKMSGTEMVPNNVYHYRVVACVKDDTKDEHIVSMCDKLTKGTTNGISPEELSELTDKIPYTSKLYEFISKPFDDPKRALNFLFYGDLGLLNAQSVPRLIKEIENQDLIIHNGDFAYDLNTRNGKYGDRFMRLMEQIAAKIPYQTSVGNHEIAANFSEYNHRFTMINRGAINHGTRNNFFYSFNAGPIHFIAISTEFYYFLDYVGLAPLVNQYNWLVDDLKHATSAEERAKRPWIVVFGHRPMYCSSRDGDDCSKESNILRKGLPFVGSYALEKLFYNFGVDVEMYSHEHQYERFLPIFDGQVFNGTTNKENPYENSRAPIHLISGSAGCQEDLDPFEGHPATGSVKQIAEYGFTKVRASRCKIEFEQISDDQRGDIVDSFVLLKNVQTNFPSRGPALEGC